MKPHLIEESSLLRLVNWVTFLSLLSDSNQRPRDYKSLCYVPVLEDSKGAGRVRLARLSCKAGAKVGIFFRICKLFA